MGNLRIVVFLSNTSPCNFLLSGPGLANRLPWFIHRIDSFPLLFPKICVVCLTVIWPLLCCPEWAETIYALKSIMSQYAALCRRLSGFRLTFGFSLISKSQWIQKVVWLKSRMTAAQPTSFVGCQMRTQTINLSDYSFMYWLKICSRDKERWEY